MNRRATGGRSAAQRLVVARRIDVDEASRVGDRDVHYFIGMCTDDGLRTNVERSVPQFLEETSIEYDGMTVPFVDCGPHNCGVGPLPLGDHATNRFRRRHGYIHERHDGRGRVRRHGVDSEQQRGELTTGRIRVADDARRNRQALVRERISDAIVIAAGHDNDVGDARCSKRVSNRRNERSAGRRLEQGLREAHTGRVSGGQNYPGQHAASYANSREKKDFGHA